MKVDFKKLDITEIPEIPSQLDSKKLNNLTYREHSEIWCQEHGWDVPERGTLEWQEMYEKYIEWAFASFK